MIHTKKTLIDNVKVKETSKPFKYWNRDKQTRRYLFSLDFDSVESLIATSNDLIENHNGYNHIDDDWVYENSSKSETDDLLASGDAKDSLIELIQTIKDELELDGLYDLTGHNKSCKRQRRFVVDGANVDVNRVLSGEPEAFEIIKRDGKKEFVSIGINCSLSHQNGESAFARNTALAYVTAEILESLGYGVEIKLISATWDGTNTVTVNKLYNVDQTNYYSENCISAIAKESDAPVDIRNISAVALTGYLRRHIFAIKHAVYGQAGGECIKSSNEMLAFANVDIMISKQWKDGEEYDFVMKTIKDFTK